MKKKNGRATKKEAKKYVDSQLKVLRKYGTRISARDYRTLVNTISRATSNI